MTPEELIFTDKYTEIKWRTAMVLWNVLMLSDNTRRRDVYHTSGPYEIFVELQDILKSVHMTHGNELYRQYAVWTGPKRIDEAQFMVIDHLCRNLKSLLEEEGFEATSWHSCYMTRISTCVDAMRFYLV